jgi:23S rRNA pseudouridine1911/1915/1917 synthase
LTLDSSPSVLLEDNHCVVVDKPARTPTAGDDTGDRALLDEVREYLRVKYDKPGNVFVGLVHRLDRPVSGVVLFARTSKGAARLAEQFRTGSVRKRYLAVVAGRPPQLAGELVDWLVKDSRTNLVRRVPAGSPGTGDDTPRESRLRYSVVRTIHDRTVLLVEPLTGRSHQIRVQLAGMGTPILGDVKYGGPGGWEGSIALHAWRLDFEHPTRREAISVTAPVPAEWTKRLGYRVQAPE